MRTDIDDLWEEPVEFDLSFKTIPYARPVNVVATVDFGARINTQQCVSLVSGTSFRASPLSAVTTRPYSRGKNRLPTAQIFDSGMIGFMGAAHISMILFQVHVLRLILSDIAIEKSARMLPTRIFINNIISSGSYFPIDRARFEKGDASVVKQEKSFSGVIYPMHPPGCQKPISITIFGTGKFIISKMNPLSERNSFIHILEVLQRNRNTEEKIEIEKYCVEKLTKALQTGRGVGYDQVEGSRCQFAKMVFERAASKIKNKKLRTK